MPVAYRGRIKCGPGCRSNTGLKGGQTTFSSGFGRSPGFSFGDTPFYHLEFKGSEYLNTLLAIPFIGKVQDYAINRRQWGQTHEQ
jgi:hypothetical protein